jgi:hypothetical protein
MNNYAPPNAPVASHADTGMKTKHALIALLVVIAFFGAVLAFLEARGIAEPSMLQMGSTLAFSALTYWWFWLDSEARAYKRSPFLSVGIIAIGLIAVPYYLLRSRPKGARLSALGKLLGFIFLLVGALMVGSMCGFWLGSI